MMNEKFLGGNGFEALITLLFSLSLEDTIQMEWLVSTPWMIVHFMVSRWFKTMVCDYVVLDSRRLEIIVNWNFEFLELVVANL